MALTPVWANLSMQPESSDGFASVGTILPKEEATLLPGGLFALPPNFKEKALDSIARLITTDVKIIVHLCHRRYQFRQVFGETCKLLFLNSIPFQSLSFSGVSPAPAYGQAHLNRRSKEQGRASFEQAFVTIISCMCYFG